MENKRKKTKMQIEPKDPSKKHFYISLVKSALRILGCLAVIAGAGVLWLAISLLLAELLGIAEEL